MGAVDDGWSYLRDAAGGDLLRVQAVHGWRTYRRRGEDLKWSLAVKLGGKRLWHRYRSKTSRRASAAPRSSTASASKSTTASSWCWLARRDAASRRCCACW